MDETCRGCGRADPEFSLEPDDGSEVLACGPCLASIADHLFASWLASGEMKLYDLVRR